MTNMSRKTEVCESLQQINCFLISLSPFDQFFEQIWDKAGESLELTLKEKGRNMVIGDETNPDKFYR